MTEDLDQLCINTIRTLAMDAVQKANSGHPGTPMGLAPVAYTVWQDFMRFDPADALWPNRDRFVLSVGHASMLLYAVLHLTQVKQQSSLLRKAGGLAISLDDIKNFRQLDSPCAGHPEFHMASGIECTTGPLGQGVAMSVGMAIAERFLATRYNKPDATLIDYDVYALCGDGCMMEGISSEAASMAGHLRLSNLCWIYDSNRISIEGSTDLAFSEDVATRFMAYGWNVLRVRDANDLKAVKLAIDAFKREQSRPTFILVESHIGYGAPHKQDTREAHGEPLGAEEIKGAKRNYGWPEDAQFLVPDGVYDHFANGLGKRGAELHAGWQQTFERYKQTYPDLAHEFELLQQGGLPEGWEAALQPAPADPKGAASRDSSGKALNALAERIPYLLGGAADLSPSTKTNLKGKGESSFEATNYGGRNFHFGVREHAMGAVVNGMALCGLRSYGSGFLIFSDYMRAAIRLSAIQELPVVWIFTHDSIGVGEDGPTHQPIEQLVGLRSIPGLHTIRPADSNEVNEAWRVALTEKHTPTCLILSRQALPTVDRQKFASAAGLARGAYVLADPPDGRRPELILMGTGSEVELCVSAWETLTQEGIAARVVSMPCWDIFEKQDEAYRRSVLPDDVLARVSVEQAATMGWDRYVGLHGAIIGMHTFGASAPLKALQAKFGFSADKVVQAARDQLAWHQRKHAAE